jgi:hypothetical protein
MKVGLYSCAWSIESKRFQWKDALDNWAIYADEISVAIPQSDTDDSAGIMLAYAKDRDYNLSIVRTPFDFTSDPFAYGKTVNAALQNCSADLYLHNDLDERTGGDRRRLEEMHAILKNRYDIRAFWVPNIDLYGAPEKYLAPVKRKWHVHGGGLFRGAVPWGIKSDGRPDYNKTSTDELLDIAGNLAPAAALFKDLEIETIREYVAAGWPMVYHEGYLRLNDRLERSLWWRDFWTKATNGDPNKHPTSIEELAAKETKEHGLPLWPTKNRTHAG